MRLFDYQKENIEKLTDSLHKNKCALLIEGAGTGKTIQTIHSIYNIMQKVSIEKVIIFTTKSIKSKDVWLNEFKKFNEEKNLIPLTKITTHSYSEAQAGKYVNSVGSLMVLDEVHKCKNAKSKTHKNIKMMVDKASYSIGLTATPITNLPEDLFGCMNVSFTREVMQKLNSRNITAYKEYYMSYVTKALRLYSGVRYIKEFVRVKRTFPSLISTIQEKYGIIRHAENLKDKLPDLVAEDIYVDIEKELSVEHKKAVSKVSKSLGLLSDEKALKYINLHYMPIRRMIGSLKAKLAYNDIERIIKKTNKVIIFTYFKETTSTIEDLLNQNNIKARSITGETVSKKRLEIFNEFQNGELPVLVATIPSCNTGITLTTSNTIIFLEQSYSPAEMEQAVGRIYRLSQENDCEVYNIHSKDNEVDKRITNILKNKEQLINKILYQ